ncbi:MAG: metal ABC transporter permease [Marinovum sp.]|nr:metal ABC transporter permease [Marinovum sp.]MBT6533616.1 metal ABC transporter permease [Marinovum sp.]
MLWSALSLTLGYNATLVTLGATLLGIATGISGTFLYLRKNALISDAISHATLPGLGAAFLLMTGAGLDGRNLIGLLGGSAISAALGLMIVTWLTTKTRLSQDAAIGSVLSVFFAFGVVLLTVIQALPAGRQAGLETFLLGSTAGMLFNDAVLILVLGAITTSILVLFRRPIILVSFDSTYAQTLGISPQKTDYIVLAVALAVTVIGMKIAGLILIVALLIIAPVAARFWSEKSDTIILISAIFGGLSGYLGAAISATAPGLPTGPIIVLCSFVLFLVSFLLAPRRGVLAAARSFWVFQRTVHMTQGLLSIAQNQPIYEPKTKRILQRRGFIRADGVATQAGRALAAKTLLNERRWSFWRNKMQQTGDLDESIVYSLVSIETKLTHDQIESIDRGLSEEQQERV